MSPTLFHYSMDHFNALFLLLITSQANSETWLSPSAIHVFNCSILHILAVSELLTHTAMTTINWNMVLIHRYFCLSSYRLISKVRSEPFPRNHSIRWFHAFVIQLDCFVTSCIPSRHLLSK